MNHEGPHDLCPTGSVRDVFLENSYGALQIESTVTDWILLNETEAYYSNGVSGRSKKIWEAIYSALEYLDTNQLVDFTYFDQDQSGRIDSITFLHSGFGAEWGGTDHDGVFYDYRLWSHKWSLFEAPFVSSSGVEVLEYHLSPSLWGRSGDRIGRIGVIAHETGHFLGIPDLYDIDGTGRGVGCFALMANSWGFDGTQYYPPHMTPWTKLVLGWAVPYYPTPGVNLIEASELQNTTQPQIYAITEGFPHGEFLLIENRQKYGYDQKMPQSGIVIWHIDHGTGGTNEFRESLKREGFPGQDNWPHNGNHYGIALVQADGEYHLERARNMGDAGDYFHGEGVDELLPCQNVTSCQYPNTDSYQSGNVSRTGAHITDISISGDIMSFHYYSDAMEVEDDNGPSSIPSSLPSTSPSASPSEAPTEQCFERGQLCFYDAHCCSSVCRARKRRFFGECK